MEQKPGGFALAPQRFAWRALVGAVGTDNAGAVLPSVRPRYHTPALRGLGNCSLSNRDMQKTVLGAPPEAYS